METRCLRLMVHQMSVANVYSLREVAIRSDILYPPGFFSQKIGSNALELNGIDSFGALRLPKRLPVSERGLQRNFKVRGFFFFRAAHINKWDSESLPRLRKRHLEEGGPLTRRWVDRLIHLGSS